LVQNPGQLSYEGPKLETLKEECCSSKKTTGVDFDLALKDLEDAELVATGPLKFHDNPPGSSVVFIGTYSKREYVHLTAKGYKVARR
jgi:hypothetical protein